MKRFQLEPERYLWDLLAYQTSGEVTSRWIGNGEEGFSVVDIERKLNIEQLEAHIGHFYLDNKENVFPKDPQKVRAKYNSEQNILEVHIFHKKSQA